MKILMITDRMDVGGAETHIATLSLALTALGHTVAVASSGGQEAQRLVQHGIAQYCLPLHRKDPLSLWRSRQGLLRLIRREGFDILHAHARLPALLCHILNRRRPLCFVTTVHARFRMGFWRKRLTCYGYAASTVSEDLRQELLRRAPLPCTRVRVIPNGLDLTRFAPSSVPHPQPAPHLLFLSRMDSDCSLTARLLCAIAPRLVSRFGALHITLAGGGDAYREIRTLAEKTNSMLGFCCVEAVGALRDPLPYLQACDLLIGVSRCALEGMACKTTVLLSGDEGCLGLLTPDKLSAAEKSNFCARGEKPPTEDSLWEAICQFFAMSAMQRRDLGKALHRYVQQHHNVRHTATQTLSLYREAKSACAPRKGGGILLCGYYGYGNLGDDALLHAAVARARRECPHGGVSALTRKPRTDCYRFGVHAVNRYHPLSVLRTLHKADALVLGGGSILQDKSSLRSLLYYAALIRLAIAQHKQIWLWANGLGPFHTHMGKRIVQHLLPQCHRVGLRDAESLALAQHMGVTKAHCQKEPDPLITLPLSPSRTAFCPPAPFAVFALRGDASEEELSRMRAMINLFRQNGVQTVLTVMHPPMDEAASRRMAEQTHSLCHTCTDTAELLAWLRHACFACSMRLHLLLLAHRASVPHMPMGSDPKLYAEYYLPFFQETHTNHM